MTSKVLDYILESLPKNGSFTVPAALLDPHSKIDKTLLDGKVLVKSKDILTTIPCPFGCGNSETVRRGVKDGKPFYHGRCATLKKYWTVPAEEVELLAFDKTAFDDLVRSGKIETKTGKKQVAVSGPSVREEVEKIATMKKTADERAALLFKTLKIRLADSPIRDIAAALASYETADVAIQLYDLRKDVLESRTTHSGGLLFCTLLLDVIDTYFAILDAAEFYAGARQIDIHDTPALRMAAKFGFIDGIDSARKTPANLIRGYLASKLDNRLIFLVFNSLDSLLRTLCHLDDDTSPVNWVEFSGFFYQFANTATNEEMFGPNPSPDIADFEEMLGRVALLFKNGQTLLRLREQEIYDRHPEWGVTLYGDDPDHPFDGREDRINFSKSFRAYYEKHQNPLGRFETITACLNAKQDTASAIPAGSDPRPFLTPTGTDQTWDYSAVLATLLMTPVRFSYESPVNVITSCDHESVVEGSLNPWIADAKLAMFTALVSYCRERAQGLSAGGKAKCLWMRAVAELLSARRNSEQVITLTQEQARAFMDAANNAAKEEWIERRSVGQSKADVYPPDNFLANAVATRPLTGIEEVRLAKSKWLKDHADIARRYNLAQIEIDLLAAMPEASEWRFFKACKVLEKTIRGAAERFDPLLGYWPWFKWGLSILSKSPYANRNRSQQDVHLIVDEIAQAVADVIVELLHWQKTCYKTNFLEVDGGSPFAKAIFDNLGEYESAKGSTEKIAEQIQNRVFMPDGIMIRYDGSVFDAILAACPLNLLEPTDFPEDIISEVIAHEFFFIEENDMGRDDYDFDKWHNDAVTKIDLARQAKEREKAQKTADKTEEDGVERQRGGVQGKGETAQSDNEGNKRGRKSGRTGDAYDQFVAAKKLYENPESTFYHNANGAATKVLGWVGTAKDGHYEHALKGYSLCGTYAGVKSLAKKISRTCNPSGAKRNPGRKLRHPK